MTDSLPRRPVAADMIGSFNHGLNGEVRERRIGMFRVLRHQGAEVTIDLDQAILLCVLLSDAKGTLRSGRFSRTAGRSGEVCILVPGAPTYLVTHGDNHVVQACLPLDRLSRCWAEDHGMDVRPEDIPPLLAQTCPPLASLVCRGVRGGADQEALFRELAAELLRQSRLIPQDAEEGAHRAGGLAPFKLKRVVDLVESELHRKITLGEMAGLAAMSPFHFTRAFYREMGMSAYRFVNDRRVARAIGMISYGGMSMDSVAKSVGFAHVGHLSYHMSQRYGLGAPALCQAIRF